MRDTTAIALEGYSSASDATSGAYATSTNDSAWQIGRWLRQTGQSAPRDVRPSRGNTFHVDGRKVALDWNRGLISIKSI